MNQAKKEDKKQEPDSFFGLLHDNWSLPFYLQMGGQVSRSQANYKPTTKNFFLRIKKNIIL